MAAKSSDKNVTIKWTGSAGIETANKLQKELLKALKASEKIFLDISELEDIDLTGIQIILSAKKEADSLGKSFSITGTIPPAIAEYVSSCSISFESLLSIETPGKEDK